MHVIPSICHASVCLICFRPSLRTLHLSRPTSTSSSWSFTSSLVWVGLERNPLCASANEESGPLVNNAPLTDCIFQRSRNSERGEWVEMRTQKRSDRARWFHELGSELSDEDKGRIGTSVVFTKIDLSVTEAGNNSHRKEQIIYESLSRFTTKWWQAHLTSETNGVAERAVRRVKEGTANALVQKWTTRRMVGQCDGMLLLLAQRARHDGRWHDSIREEIRPDISRTINPFSNIGWVQTNDRERQVKSTSVVKDYVERHILGLFPLAGGGCSETQRQQTMKICKNQKPQKFTSKDSKAQKKYS